MKRVIVTGLLVVLFFLLQTSVFPWFSFGGVVPNLLLILTVSCGLMGSETPGLLTGFACGMLADLFFAYGGEASAGDILGFYALLYMLIGYLGGRCNRLFYPEDVKLPIVMILSLDIALNFVCYVITFLLRARLDFSYYLLHIIVPEAVYTIIVAFAFYPLLLWIDNRLARAERGSTESIVEKD